MTIPSSRNVAAAFGREPELGVGLTREPEEDAPFDESKRHRALNSCNRLMNGSIEIDPGRVYFVTLPEGFTPQPPGQRRGSDGGGDGTLFCGTDEYVYQHFFADFGPLHLGHVYDFCKKLGRMLKQEEAEEGERGEGSRRRVYVYSSDHPHRRSNAAVLVLAYAVRRSFPRCLVNHTYSCINSSINSAITVPLRAIELLYCL